MKNYYVGGFALASMLLLASCQEDFRDESSPTISITSPAAGQMVWLDASLTVEAADQQSVSRVAFYLNDELIGEDTEAPYEMMINTKEYEDGTYVLRTVAYDRAENQAEAEQTIEVFNKLLTVEVEENYLPAPEEGSDKSFRRWIALSDAKGNVLQTKELENGTTISFDRPEGFDESFSATMVSVNEFDIDDQSAFAITYTDMAPDRWVMAGGVDHEERAVVGTAAGSLVTPDFYFEYSSPNGSFHRTSDSYSEDSVQTLFDFDMYESPAQLYIASLPYQQAPGYVFLEGIESDNYYELTLDDIQPMKVNRTISLPSATRSSMRVRGYFSNEDQGYHLASRSDLDKSTGELSVYEPEGVFDGFSYSFSASFENFAFYRRDEETMPNNYNIPASPPATIHSAQLDNFSATIEGQRDFAAADWFDFDYEQDFRFVSWTVVGNSDKEVQWVAPALPESIAEAYPSLTGRIASLSLNHLEVVERDDIDSYEDFVSKLHKPQSEGGKVYEAVRTWLDESENSRTRAVELPASVQQRIEQLRIAYGLQ